MGTFKRIFQKIKSHKLLPYFLITVAVALSYFNALENDFIWDDEFLIEKNAYLRDFGYLPKMLVSNSTAGFGGKDNFYRPTQNILYLFIYQAFGYSKIAFHLGNILIHLFNGFLIFLLIRKLFKRDNLALLTSLLWVSHPTHVEAVTYISGTADPLSFFFCLLTLLTYPYEKKNLKRLLISLFFFTLALLSKEAIIVTPALLIICQFYQSKKMGHLKDYLQILPFWFLAFTYLLIRETLLNFDKTYSFYKTSNIYTENIHYRLYTFLATLPDYVVILFRPIKLHMERSFPVFTDPFNMPVIIGGILAILPLIIGVYCYLKKDHKLTLFAWLWFFAAFTPMTGILIPVNSFILEHWLYIPSLSLFIAVAALILKFNQYSRNFVLVLTILTLSIEIMCTIERNKDWRTPITFYKDILNYSEGSARVHNNLAMAYMDIKNLDLAINHYKKSIEISDTYPQTHYNLARALIQKNQLYNAYKHLNRSLEIQPDFIYSIELREKLLPIIENNKDMR